MIFTSFLFFCGLHFVSSYRASTNVWSGHRHKSLLFSSKNSEYWDSYFAKSKTEKKYQIIAAPAMEDIAHSIMKSQPDRFLFHPTKWGKFPDGTDNIEVGGFQPSNRISGENILLLASFHNNDATLSQFSVMVTLLQSFVDSLTVVLPFYPVGTMERVTQEGQVATANTYAQMFSNLPTCGKPTRLVIYDLHTLQNRFYLHGNAIASLQTTIPILIERLKSTDVDCIAFPDDGAAKRFGSMFKGELQLFQFFHFLHIHISVRYQLIIAQVWGLKLLHVGKHETGTREWCISRMAIQVGKMLLSWMT